MRYPPLPMHLRAPRSALEILLFELLRRDAGHTAEAWRSKIVLLPAFFQPEQKRFVLFLPVDGGNFSGPTGFTGLHDAFPGAGFGRPGGGRRP